MSAAALVIVGFPALDLVSWSYAQTERKPGA